MAAVASRGAHGTAQPSKAKAAASTQPADASNFTMLFGQTQGTDVVDQGGKGVTAPASGFDVYFGGHVTIVQDSNDDMAGALATAAGPVGVPASKHPANPAASGVARDEQDSDVDRSVGAGNSSQIQSDASSPEEPVGAGGSAVSGGNAVGGSSIPQGVHFDASEGGGGGGGEKKGKLKVDYWGSGVAFDEALPDHQDAEGAKKTPRENAQVQVLDGVTVVAVDKLSVALVALDESAGLRETGKRLVELLCRHAVVEEVRVLTPTPVGYKGPGGERVKEVVADYDVADYELECEGVSTAFCFLGQTREEAGVEGVWQMPDARGEVERCNRDRVEALALALAKCGCAHLHLLSCQGADKESALAILKARGEAEERVQLAGFSRVSVYRPGFLKGKRQSSLANTVAAMAVPTLEVFAPTDASIYIETAAKAVLFTAFARRVQALEVLENADMLKKGGSEGDGWIRFPELDAMDWDEVWSTRAAREQWRDEARQGQREAEEDVVLQMFDFGQEDGAEARKRPEVDIDMDEDKEENRKPKAGSGEEGPGEQGQWDFKLPEVSMPELSAVSLPELGDILPTFSKVESRDTEAQTDVTANPESGKVLIYRRV